MYELKYLPIALKDLHEIINYIANILKAPHAAMGLLDEFDKSLSRLQEFPYSNKIYLPVEELETEYRMLPVKNYLVFYVVTETTVEIHRFVNGKMDYEKLIT